jgi:hypothetical protein
LKGARAGEDRRTNDGELGLDHVDDVHGQVFRLGCVGVPIVEQNENGCKRDGVLPASVEPVNLLTPHYGEACPIMGLQMR